VHIVILCTCGCCAQIFLKHVICFPFFCITGANVVGSDIDGGSLVSAGPAQTDGNTKPAYSKNANFKRRDGQSQRSRSVMDNFRHYQLQERVLDLAGLPVDAWLLPTRREEACAESDRTASIEDQVVRKYDKVSESHYLGTGLWCILNDTF
jgi:hypothetical protein